MKNTPVKMLTGLSHSRYCYLSRLMFLYCYFCLVSFIVLSPLLKLRYPLITVMSVDFRRKERRGLKSLHAYFKIFAPLSTSEANKSLWTTILPQYVKVAECRSRKNNDATRVLTTTFTSEGPGCGLDDSVLDTEPRVLTNKIG